MKLLILILMLLVILGCSPQPHSGSPPPVNQISGGCGVSSNVASAHNSDCYIDSKKMKHCFAKGAL